MLPSIAFSLFGQNKFNSIKEYSCPLLIISLENLPPEIIFNESIINDFPAPVSPVITLNPSLNSTDISSIIPIFFICKVPIILIPPYLKH